MARFLARDSERLSRCSLSRETSSLWYACASALLCAHHQIAISLQQPSGTDRHRRTGLGNMIALDGAAKSGVLPPARKLFPSVLLLNLCYPQSGTFNSRALISPGQTTEKAMAHIGDALGADTISLIAQR